MNNIAKEAEGKFFIDIAGSIIKALLIGIFILPISVIMKTAGEGGNALSFIALLEKLSDSAYLSVILLMIISGYFAVMLHKLGIKILNQIKIDS